jgi:hydroxyethylthiazole kinase
MSGDILTELRRRAPRVQCLTNTVAQEITANVLHAIGARASMSSHPDEIEAMTASADAVLINLGTPDAQRIAAIQTLLAGHTLNGKTVVLDPVFAQHAPLRMDVARQILSRRDIIVKANAIEIAAVRDAVGEAMFHNRLTVTTGDVDVVDDGRTRIEIKGGHVWMGTITGLGCALGAVVAACCAVAPDRMMGARAAVELFATAGARAAQDAKGPGSFAVALLDALHHASHPQKG